MMGMKGTNIFESVVESVLVFPCPLLWCLSFLTFGSSVCVCVYVHAGYEPATNNGISAPYKACDRIELITQCCGLNGNSSLMLGGLDEPAALSPELVSTS